jgi:5'-3' exonuclease
MGIERFFSAINKNFDIVSLMSNIKKLKTDVFFIDFNSIIHYVSSKYISEINTKGNINKNNTYDENSLILRVKNYVDDLLENVECNLVYIAADRLTTLNIVKTKLFP